MAYVYTPQEFWQKCDYEGGVCDAILGYGLDETDLDDSDPELKEAVKAFRLAARDPLDKLQDLLEKYEGDGE
ncbi:Uncharacterised protein [Mycobacteroides abscessus subsp. abscessus]|nr:Uncharacterised protein [Mycobacteroides abscessus subsp. abscessus]